MVQYIGPEETTLNRSIARHAWYQLEKRTAPRHHVREHRWGDLSRYTFSLTFPWATVSCLCTQSTAHAWTPVLIPHVTGAFVLCPVESELYWRVAFSTLLELIPTLVDGFEFLISDLSSSGPSSGKW
jgi:hypothetical protein